MAKNSTKLAEKIQNNRTSFWVSGFVPGDFFVGIGVLHVPTEFRTCM